jgi:hypothetical protein
MNYRLAAPIGGLFTGYFALQESLFNHSNTTKVTSEEYMNNSILRKKIQRRHTTMKNVLNVDMSHMNHIKELPKSD